MFPSHTNGEKNRIIDSQYPKISKGLMIEVMDAVVVMAALMYLLHIWELSLERSRLSWNSDKYTVENNANIGNNISYNALICACSEISINPCTFTPALSPCQSTNKLFLLNVQQLTAERSITIVHAMQDFYF